jgi:hypothetical protein
MKKENQKARIRNQEGSGIGNQESVNRYQEAKIKN